MAGSTAGGVLTQVANQNKAGNIKNVVGVNSNSMLSPKAQQHALIMAQINQFQKGGQFSVLISNPHQSGANVGDLNGTFDIFDFLLAAQSYGAAATAGTVVITSTFLGLNNAAAFTALQKFIGGTRMGSVGTVFTWGNSSYIATTALRFWNGNATQYTPQTMQDYITMAQDSYANNQAQLVINSALWINEFLAITGVLPDPGSGNPATTLQILFNVCTYGNF